MSRSPAPNLPAAADSRGPARRRVTVIVVCWALVLLDGIDTFVYGSALPDMITGGRLGLTDATAGDIGSYTTFGMLVGTILSGTITRWVGRRPTVFSSVALFTLATVGCGLSSSASVFGVFRLLCGFGLGALLPIAIAYGMEFATGRTKALATAGSTPSSPRRIGRNGPTGGRVSRHSFAIGSGRSLCCSGSPRSRA